MLGVAGFLIVRHFGASLPFIRRWKSVTGEHQPVEPMEGAEAYADGGERREPAPEAQGDQSDGDNDSSEHQPVAPQS